MTPGDSGVVDDEVRALFDATAGDDVPSPSTQELVELSTRRGTRLRVIKVRAKETCEGASICAIRDGLLSGISVRIQGRFGQDIHDYGRIPATSPAALRSVLNAIERDAKDAGCDLVYLDNVLLEVAAAGGTRGLVQVDQCKVFRATLGEKGWGDLVDRKSLRRHWRSAQQMSGFATDVVEGNPSREAIEELASLHRERWMFEGRPSAFENLTRVDDYLNGPANKILVVVRIRREPMSILYGMRYGKTLLWHTPVINVKYLGHSPLEVLLVATAKYCQSIGVDCIDFGLGGEGYKDRFANDVRGVGTILLPTSARGVLVLFAHTGGLGRRAKQAMLAGRRRVSHLRARALALLEKVWWYESDSEASPQVADQPSDFSLVRSFPEFVDFARRHRFPLARYQYERFRDGAAFAAIHRSDEIISHGWLKACDEFFVGEIGRIVSAPGRVILFDFVTKPEFRGKGYYPRLLRTLVSASSPRRVAIFVRASNAASISGIEKVGFRRIASFRGFPPTPRATVRAP